MKSFRLGYNKTASHVLRDLVHRLPRHSLLWKCYVYDFLGTRVNVISTTHIQFARNSSAGPRVHYTKESVNRNSFMPLRDVWLSLPRLSRNSQLPKLLWIFLYRILFKSDERCIKLWKIVFPLLKYGMIFTAPTFTKPRIAKRHNGRLFCIEFHPDRSRNMGNEGEYSCTVTWSVPHRADVVKLACWTTFCTELWYRISWISNRQFSCWY